MLQKGANLVYMSTVIRGCQFTIMISPNLLLVSIYLVTFGQAFGLEAFPAYSQLKPIGLAGFKEATFLKSNFLSITNQFAELSQIFDSPSKLIDQIFSLAGHQISNQTTDNYEMFNIEDSEPAKSGNFSSIKRLFPTSIQTLPLTTALLKGIPETLTNVSAGCLADFYTILKDAKTFQFVASLNCSNANATLEEMCNAYKVEELTKVAYIFALIDSFGKPGSGISDGNKFWLGNWHECRGIAVTKGGSSFKGQYCRATLHMTIVTTPTDFLYGLCVPDSCDSTDVDYLAYYALQFLASDPIYGKIAAGIEIYDAVCYPERQVLNDPKAVVTIVILALWLTVLTFATAFDVLHHRPKMRRLRRVYQDFEVQQAFFGTNQNITLDKPETEIEYLENAPLLTHILLGLSLYSNFLKIMSTERRPGSFDCIHGIRFLSMCWVILGHTYFFALLATDNLSKIPEILKEGTMQTVANATVSVDSFFLISSILLAYLWHKEAENTNGKMLKNSKTWFLYYFHRYVRLTPVYMVIMGVDVALLKYFGYGPLWPSQGVEPFNCKYWWRNLLYINNFFDTSEACMGHTWFLANDMQFHVFAPIILVPIYFFPAIATGFASLLILGSAIWRGYYIVHNNYMPSEVFTVYPGYNSDSAAYFKDVYEAPWMRLGPYVWGLVVGYIIFKTKGEQVKINKLLNLALWAFFIAVLCAVVYGMYPYVGPVNRVPKAVQGLYGAVNRTVWGIGISWIVFACMTGNGGFINGFLAWPGFFPFSRLTYCAYLMHPYVMELIYFSADVPVHLSSQYTMVYYFLANICISYATALVFSLSFEVTFMNLEKMFLQAVKPENSAKRTDSSEAAESSVIEERNEEPFDDNNSESEAFINSCDSKSMEKCEPSKLIIIKDGTENPNYDDSHSASSSKDIS